MMKVLIVDDDEALADLIKEMIEREGIYRVKTAANGEEGYEVFLQFKPDIILTYRYPDAGKKRPRNGKGHTGTQSRADFGHCLKTRKRNARRVF